LKKETGKAGREDGGGKKISPPDHEDYLLIYNDPDRADVLFLRMGKTDMVD
jgi:hypothetical protein